MNKIFLGIAITILCISSNLIAQKTFPTNGVYDHRDKHFVFENATIYKSYNQKLENATLIIKNGKIVSIGSRLSIPKNAVVFDMKGKTIYPSFIEMYSNYGLPKPTAAGKRPERLPQMLSNKKGAYGWNEALRTEFSSDKVFKVNKEEAKKMRKLGFGTILTHQMNGMSRGTSALVNLGDDRENISLLKTKVAHHLSFSKGKSTQNYPSSLMGAIALFRQTYYDAQWYKNGGSKEERNLSLEAWNKLQELPQIFEVRDKLEILRAHKIAQEFNMRYIFKGSGDEYQRLDEIKATNAQFIIPVKFPEAFDVSDPYSTMMLELSDMKHWELAPSNPARLAKANIEFALTSHGLKNKETFLKNIKKAIKYGLSEEQALKAITYSPAKILKIESILGSLESGKLANFIITDGNIFEDKTTIYQNWINGKGYILQNFKDTPTTAVYNLSYGDKNTMLFIEGDPEKPNALIAPNVPSKDSLKKEVIYLLKKDLITLSFSPDSTGVVHLSGTKSNLGYKGEGTLPDGRWIKWSATPNRANPTIEKKEIKKEKKEIEQTGKVVYPFMAYGWEKRPQTETFLFKNATVWTNEKEGILEKADVLVKNSKIVQVGNNLSASGATEIDATGKHLTSGIIDEHAHIAISRGVNEGTQYSSAEVSIADVVNSEDINIYRQLAGGVTAAQLLHGSANPIGGQSGIVKFRWGATPEEMKIKDAAPFIKFALGENVKQVNWGDKYRIRFPQSRMGVEQVYDDHFTRAREYGNRKRSGKPYRKDLEMETLLEILEKKRFITCHSYVQSEINMLMKIAEKHGFTLNTFTHILEGYKVADKMQKHGAGGSTFSDWWAYKYEVIDAIPQNAAILNEQGVTVAINSDDAEMGRRLNQEAAKSVMYGGMSEEDAWKLVTLNPAILLHLDHRMGSIKVGKDADLVLWSDNPLSIYAKPEMTLVDGIKYFDREKDQKMRKDIQKERARLIQKMLQHKKKGGKTKPPSKKHHHLYHCDDLHDEIED